MSAVNPTKLDQELRAAGVRVLGCCSDGRVDLAPDATGQDAAIAAAVLAAHDPGPTPEQRMESAGFPRLLAALVMIADRGAAAPLWARAVVGAAATKIEQARAG